MIGVVAVAGEALVDLVPGPDGGVTPRLGGGPFNAARAAARVGSRTAFLGAISTDPHGVALAAALAADGVALDPRLRTDRPTSLATATLDEAGVATYRFDFAGSSAEHLEPRTALAAVTPDVGALLIGGLGLVLRPMADAVEALAGHLTGRALVMLDPNIRPQVISDREDFLARLRRLIAMTDVVKVSEEDLAFLAPGVPPAEAASGLLRQGPRLVLLTLGEDGAVALGAFGMRAASAPVVQAVDTIGAGDTFCGAWLSDWMACGAALSDGDAVQGAMVFACRAAALSCVSAGAAPPTRADLGRWPAG
ncbi:MAG: carbohydrate kinase [Alphaproteobacteria bacterium]|nr:carbohydrate kinase [Alphaproteobacteria bacterium]MBU1516777.1 carbohydrate kinase [Alphaproteobacteria bacterium]MBU2092471.1 carbohydrate kinase [Alphaproteobacteria bacterium]MBU2152398.1 carbohydrate kinase [Alphaproteobacteria bacterium]MBU2305609.1 carbohydrate kinase [Alphaproteobacteria bacterium]